MNIQDLLGGYTGTFIEHTTQFTDIQPPGARKYVLAWSESIDLSSLAFLFCNYWKSAIQGLKEYVPAKSYRHSYDGFQVMKRSPLSGRVSWKLFQASRALAWFYLPLYPERSLHVGLT